VTPLPLSSASPGTPSFLGSVPVASITAEFHTIHPFVIISDLARKYIGRQYLAFLYFN